MDKELIRSNIASAAADAAAHGAVLCAVIKTRSDEEVDFAVRECGVRVVGENRVQELLAHYPTLVAAGADIHFIGHLQKNKVKYIVGKVSTIESLDSVALAEEIERQVSKIGRKIDALIEINIGREEHDVYPLSLLHALFEVQRAAMSNNTEVCVHVLLGHSDTVV